MAFSISLLAPMLAGALLNLDKQVFGPFMVGRPLVVGFILGLITGELHYSVWLGLSAELLWLATIPLGGQLTPNPGLAVTAVFTAWLANNSDPSVGPDLGKVELVISFLTIPFWAMAFTAIDKFSRQRAKIQLNRARADLEAGYEPRLFWRNLSGLGVTLVYSLGALLVATVVNSIFLKLIPGLIPDFILWSFRPLYLFIPFLGLLGMAVFLESKVINLYVYGILAGLLALSTAQ